MTSTDASPVTADAGSPAAGTTRRGRLGPVVETGLIVAGLVIFAFVLPHYVIADALMRYDNVLAVLHGHLPPGRYSLVGPLFAAPLVVVDRLTRDHMWAGELYNTIVFGLGILALYGLLRRRADAALLRRFLLVLVAGSMFAAHVVHWNSEVFTAMAVAVGLAAVAVRRFARLGWVAVVLGVVNTPAAVVGLVLVVGKRMAERRRLRYALAVLAAVALIGAENWIRNGSPLTTGYDSDRAARTLMPYSGGNGFTYPFFFGLLSQLLSFGKGLLFFAPGLILPVRRPMRAITIGPDTTLYRLYGWWLLFLTGLVLVYFADRGGLRAVDLGGHLRRGLHGGGVSAGLRGGQLRVRGLLPLHARLQRAVVPVRRAPAGQPDPVAGHRVLRGGVRLARRAAGRVGRARPREPRAAGHPGHRDRLALVSALVTAQNSSDT